MPARKKVRKPSAQEEQLQILRQILAELQTLNASLAGNKTEAQGRGAPAPPDGDSDEELEEYE